MAASLESSYLICQLTKSSARVAVARGSLGRNRCQETPSEDCNRLRTLVSVCQ
jgi:hypothetical protein